MKGIQLLKFLSILNADSKVSITNVALIFMLFRFLIVPVLGIHDAIIFLGILANYIHKRYEDNKAMKYTDLEQQLDEIRAGHLSLKDKIDSLENVHSTIAKQSDEVKRMISESNISRAFNPRNKML